MRLAMVLIILGCQCLAGLAQAGAWLREPGKSFLSSSISVNYFRDLANESYFEFGYRKDITLGFDMGLYTLRNGLQSGYFTAFMRRPLGDSSGNNRFSYELGVGAGWLAAEISPHAKIGLSWGRGIKLGEKSGWINVDGSVNYDFAQNLSLTKIDATVGLNFTDKTAAMMQLHLARLDGLTTTTFAPSLIIAPWSDKYRIQIGALAPIDDFDSTAIKVGLWREF